MTIIIIILNMTITMTSIVNTVTIIVSSVCEELTDSIILYQPR